MPDPPVNGDLVAPVAGIGHVRPHLHEDLRQAEGVRIEVEPDDGRPRPGVYAARRVDVS